MAWHPDRAMCLARSEDLGGQPIELALEPVEFREFRWRHFDPFHPAAVSLDPIEPVEVLPASAAEPVASRVRIELPLPNLEAPRCQQLVRNLPDLSL